MIKYLLLIANIILVATTYCRENQDPIWLLASAIQQNTERIEELKKIIQSESFEDHSSYYINRYRGLHKSYKILNSDGKTIYRHFTTPEIVGKILSSKSLIAGHKPSHISRAGIVTINPDIYGIFFTPVSTPPSSAAELVPIDFSIPKGFKIIQTYVDEFVIVGPRRIQEWLLKEINLNPDKYQDYNHELIYDEVLKSFQLKQKPLEVPINIVAIGGKQVSHFSNLDFLISPYLDQIFSYLTLPEQYLEFIYGRDVLPYQYGDKFIERYTAPPTVEKLYRGMYLTKDDVKNILINGLEIGLAQKHGVGGEGIFFSSNIEEAKNYIFSSASAQKIDQGGIGVVVVVDHDQKYKLLERSNQHLTATIYKINESIKINEVSDLLFLAPYGLESYQKVILDLQNYFKKHKIYPLNNWTNLK